MPSDNDMVGPGAYEVNAMNAIGAGRVDEAQVHAILALASAVSRWPPHRKLSPPCRSDGPFRDSVRFQFAPGGGLIWLAHRVRVGAAPGA